METSAMVEQSKQQGSGVPVYSASSSNKLPPLLTGKYTSPCCFKMLKNFPQNMMPIQFPAQPP